MTSSALYFEEYINNLDEFIDFDQDKNEYMQKQHGLKIFNSKEFLDSVHEDDFNFVKEMINTQLFTSFIDKAFKVKNGLLQKDEKDSEKIMFFLKWLNILHNGSFKQLRAFLEDNLVSAIKDYFDKQIITIEDFKNKYIEKLNSKMEEGMTTKIYLMQESVVHSELQLSLISKINDKLVISDISLPSSANSKREQVSNPK